MSRYINFHLDNCLSVVGRITRPAEDVLFRHKERLSIIRAGSTPRLAEALLCADVSWEVGMVRLCKGGQKKSSVNLKAFEHWLTASLDTNPAKEVISTSMGDVILDPGHADCLYPRNLLLKGPNTKSWFSQRLKFAYNYSYGCTMRDRMSLQTHAEKRKRLCTI